MWWSCHCLRHDLHRTAAELGYETCVQLLGRGSGGAGLLQLWGLLQQLFLRAGSMAVVLGQEEGIAVASSLGRGTAASTPGSFII